MILYQALVASSNPVVRVLFRPRVEGLEHVPTSGGFLLCANHLSGLDVWALAYACHGHLLRSMAKVELFTPVTGPFLKSLGAFPARRGEQEGGAVAAATALARAGHVVVVFPEGARRRRDRTHAARAGAARAALAAGVPLVPAAIRGTDRWKRLVRWQVAIGAPIPLADLGELAPAAAAREATSRLWDAITALEAGLEPTRSVG